MIPISNLNTGFNDAVNYKLRENKEIFNNFFVNQKIIEDIVPTNISFLVGDKGTGKTAYAVYMTNNETKNTNSVLHFLMETEYQKFVQLKKEHSLVLSDYTQAWRVIIYLLMAKKISQNAPGNFSFFGNNKFQNLINAIDDFYNDAFSPEIITAMNFAENSRVAAQVMNKHIGKFGGENSTSVNFVNQTYQINLLYLRKQFEEAFRSIKLVKNHIIFIDGIDVRPQNIPHEEYLDCVRGLANAIWSVNNDFFANIKDSHGRMKVVLLVRPDIFNLLGLQNQNTKMRDNSVLLDWRTKYPEYRKSELFLLADKILSSQQESKLEHGQAWDHYFPFKVESKMKKANDSFISFLRFSLFRPRDIVTMINIMKLSALERDKEASHFIVNDFDSPTFRRAYSTYMLGEIKDQISFYHTPEDYEDFLRFFSYLDGKTRFNYEEYTVFFEQFYDEIISKKRQIPKFFGSPEDFLQFLYELSIICYIQEAEDDAEKFISWCHQDRSTVNISPKVITRVRYEIHYGLAKALNVGKRFK
ncbi:MAG TPA: hypothetical protein VEZ52_05340 [Desulfovibrio sp.]|uniref:P-loop ATPase, Sll1717 family n=1 Tax=Desulfovibrio sp. TaxID=885 RepID=UPI002D4806A2|nr:hypothetical protein [Desulfovibrio sp.]HZF61031.1 hypothetical protein [Desulfovibrio sp.]